VSPEWSVAAISRQGSLYDSLRTGLYETRPPALKMFDAKTENLLKMAEQSGREDLQEQADAVRVKVQKAWMDAVKRSSTVPTKWRSRSTPRRSCSHVGTNISNAAVVRAIRRLGVPHRRDRRGQE